MRVVIDTNVFVSAVLKDKSLPAVAVHLVAQRGVLLKSTATERQLFDVLARPYFASLIAPVAYDWLKKLLAAAEAAPTVGVTENCTTGTASIGTIGPVGSGGAGAGGAGIGSGTAVASPRLASIGRSPP